MELLVSSKLETSKFHAPINSMEIHRTTGIIEIGKLKFHEVLCYSLYPIFDDTNDSMGFHGILWNPWLEFGKLEVL